MAITTKEIAQICNVSRGTVDRALNGRSGISDVTRERIQRVAREQNYRPHLIASSLSLGKSMSIGVVVFDLKNRFFSQMCNVISKVARSNGYFTYIAVSEKEIDSELQILHNLASRRVDGLIMLPITQGNDYIRQLKVLEMPIVTIGNHLPGIPHVSINDFDAAYDSAYYISQAGYRRICFVCPPLRKKGEQNGTLNITSQDLRAQGFKHYMEMNPEFKYEILMQKDFCNVAASIARHSPGKTAFFCSSDVYALELHKRFREWGISIPKDAGLMGFDNLDILSYINPRITTTSASIEMVGEEAIKTLFRMINGETVPNIKYIPHGIIPGETI
jgi:LacI family transcriptional regulator